MRAMPSKSNNKEIMIGMKPLKNVLILFYKHMKKTLKELMKGSYFALNSVDLLHYKCYNNTNNKSKK